MATAELAARLGAVRRLRDEAEHDWDAQARPEQREPPGEWSSWILCGGRGFGKSRSLTEALRKRVREGRSRESAIVGATAADARDVLVEGPAGVLAVCTDRERPTYEPSRRRLAWPNGAVTHVYSADEPERLRGPQHDFAIGDELRTWRYLAEALDNLLLGLRMGPDPRACFATTPAARPELRALLARPGTVVSRGTTFENLANLSGVFRERVLARYEGTRLGRAELYGEMLEDVEGALFQHGWLDRARVVAGPPGGYRRTVVGLDPADPGAGSEQGLVVVGVGEDRDLYVLASEGHRLPLGELLGRTLDLAQTYGATVVVERNHGGRALLDLLESKMAERGVRVPCRSVWASQGKVARAEGPALLAEQGHLRMVGRHPQLEEELLTFTGRAGEPFDLGDAMVWACAELAGYRSGVGEPGRAVPWAHELVEGGAVPWD